MAVDQIQRPMGATLIPPKSNIPVRVRTRFYLGQDLHAEHITPTLRS
jgi:hypothetical protein